MKIKILKGTTIDGKVVNEGDIIETDKGTFALLRGQGQAEAYTPTPEELKAEEEAAAAAVPHPAKGHKFHRETEPEHETHPIHGKKKG